MVFFENRWARTAAAPKAPPRQVSRALPATRACARAMPRVPTRLKGAVVSGKQVIADVGGDLKIESLQDSSRFEGKQQSSGGSITLSPAGVPIGGRINAGQSKVNSNYQSVIEQDDKSASPMHGNQVVFRAKNKAL